MPLTAARAAVSGGQRKTRPKPRLQQRNKPRKRQSVVAGGVAASNLDAPEGI
jgi:hypothetical protein